MGLPDVRVPADERKGRVPKVHRTGEVEGRDDAHMPLQGVVPLHHEVARSLRWNHRPIQAPAEANSIIANVNGLLHLSNTLGKNLTHLQCDHCTKRFLVLPERLTDLADNLATCRGRHICPCWLDTVHLLQALLVVLHSSMGSGGNLLSRCGVERCDHITAAMHPRAMIHAWVVLRKTQVLQEAVLAARQVAARGLPAQLCRFGSPCKCALRKGKH
mmetsp:Transcript_30274/g.76132  ORF Transcript_30274/g.76132 Transcript_30274/m.76132 type:complete len:216 (-) Transcript_30274:28-675(-)